MVGNRRFLIQTLIPRLRRARVKVRRRKRRRIDATRATPTCRLSTGRSKSWSNTSRSVHKQGQIPQGQYTRKVKYLKVSTHSRSNTLRSVHTQGQIPQGQYTLKVKYLKVSTHSRSNTLRSVHTLKVKYLKVSTHSR